MRYKQQAFTVVELLVVIAVIALLSTIGIYAISNSRKEARDAKRLADLRQLQTALSLYVNQPGVDAYPNTGEVLVLGYGSGSDHCNAQECTRLMASGFESAASGGGPVFMAQIPADPSQSTAVCDGSNLRPCNYRYAGSGGTYAINFFLEVGTGELSAGNKCLRPSGFINGACP